MKHTRDDYNRIQDPLNKIPEDEPVFLIRAKDACAIPAMAAWIAHAHQIGAKRDIIDRAINQMHAMTDWQKTHGAKTPDL